MTMTTSNTAVTDSVQESIPPNFSEKMSRGTFVRNGVSIVKQSLSRFINVILLINIHSDQSSNFTWVSTHPITSSQFYGKKRN
jgi:hypothetical protein